MRRLAAALCALLMTAPAFAGTIDAPAFPPRCPFSAQQLPSSSPYGFTPGVNWETGSYLGPAAGQLRCYRAVIGCQSSVGYTKIAFRVWTAVASSQGAVAIYTSDGATKVMDGGVKNTTSTTTYSTTGLTATNLQAGQIYLVCAAGSDVNLRVYAYADGLDQGPAPFGNPLTTIEGGTAASELAQFNDNCTALDTPYDCCTGADTGTCAGMPATVPTKTPAQTFSPWIVKVGE